MVLAQILGELICSGIFSLFAAPLLPNKNDNVELNNNNLDTTNKEKIPLQINSPRICARTIYTHSRYY